MTSRAVNPACVFERVYPLITLEAPKDSFTVVPVDPVELILDKAGDGDGAKIFKTSLNLSIATPTSVFDAKSVNKPSA